MRIFFIGLLLTGLIVIFASCTSSNPYEKPIWAYEQSMHTDAPFQFYPDTFITLNTITVKDSLNMIKQALSNYAIDSLMNQNEAAIQNLLSLLVMDLQYDMESQRQEVSQELDQLRNIGKWLSNTKQIGSEYAKMTPEKPLVRAVECRFSYKDPITGKSIKEDKIYYIHLSNNQVIATKDVMPHNTLQTH